MRSNPAANSARPEPYKNVRVRGACPERSVNRWGQKTCGRYRDAIGTRKHAPQPPPTRQRNHVISTPGFFTSIGRQPPPTLCRLRAAHLFSMACCKVCCGCKNCANGEEGKCCCGTGSAATCCQAGEYCCSGKCEAGTCCEGDSDCPEGECCNGDVRPGPGGCGPCETCTDDEDCFAYGREYCCNGICQDEPCAGCGPCEDCSWPADRSQAGIACSVSPCCDFPLFLSNSRSQTFSSSLPPGVSWNTGYPDALELCNWRWCTDSVTGVCYDSNANACRFITKARYRLLALDCSAQSVVDLTSTSSTGTFETTSPGACTDGPSFPEYYDDPVPDCPP